MSTGSICRIPGEYVRALTQPGEMMFSIPIPKLKEFIEGLRKSSIKGIHVRA